MGILDHQLLLRSFTSDVMKENVERLEIFNIYHCLRKSSFSSAIKAQEKLGKIPSSFLEWMKYCDGGLLFDTVMLSSKGYDEELDLDFETFDEYNTNDGKSEMALPEGYSVFAIRSYGDPICFNSETNDGKVYLWNIEKSIFEEIWDSFEDWLTDEIDSAIQLIGEEVLEPLDIKLGDE